MNPDQSEISTIEQRLKSSTKRLHALSAQVGAAKQVRNYDADRRKNLLAKYVVRYLEAGESATAAEQYARADGAYQSELEFLAKGHESAEQTIAEWDAEFASFEAARSLLSMQKETMRTLEG